ncbi:MAG: glycoside hydrolase family 5 protein [Solirubrobacteraceae bacterium]
MAAHAHFGSAELAAARAAHADVIRFQVSQYGLDPRSRLYSRAYVRQVRAAVEKARALGLTVIVSLQAEVFAGHGRTCPMPDAAAGRVWRELAPMFAGDRGVMFELFNEPSLSATQANWRLWRSGGTVTTSSGHTCHAVGMQTLIDRIRAEGANNVIIVPGLAWETTLAGMLALRDPASPAEPQLAYGIHYPSLTGGSTVWDREFGNVSARVPVIVTEWYASSFLRSCRREDPARAAWLLDYLASKQIGVIGYAFDVPGSIVSNWSYKPTTYSGFACQNPPTPAGHTPRPGAHEGPGQLLFNEFAGLAQASSPSLNDPRAWVVTQRELLGIARLAPGLVHHFLDTPRTFVIGSSSASLRRLGLQAAVPTASFYSETSLAAEIRQHNLPSGTRAVVFADTHSNQTPRPQQLYPLRYYRRAARVAHSHGLMLIAAPAPEVVLARAPTLSGGRVYTRFLDRRTAAGIARFADVYEVQTGAVQAQPAPYVTAEMRASLQAARAHPGVELIAGIASGQPAGARATSVSLAPTPDVGTGVSGYWLTRPCAACAGQYDRAVVAFLGGLERQGPPARYLANAGAPTSHRIGLSHSARHDA